jgi:uncharacterized lipoprotein YddW (UPF0748 family)
MVMALLKRFRFWLLALLASLACGGVPLLLSMAWPLVPNSHLVATHHPTHPSIQQQQYSRDIPLKPGQTAASAPLAQPVSTRHPNQEIRGVWLTNVDSQVLFDTATLTRTLHQLGELNFNTVYPTVWSWGYTLFPSEVATREIGYKQGLYPDLEAEGRNHALENAQGDRDMLLELVNTAHGENLQVIGWFEFAFMAPSNSELALRHPEWLTQKQGNPATARLYQEGRHTRVWLNPFHPEVQQFLLDIIAEMMANYEMDGLQIDDHFGLPVEFGYDPYTIRLYQQEHGGRRPPSNPRDPEWMRWRANKMTEFLERVFRVAKTYRPQGVVALSPNPASFAYRHYLQDWPRWWRMGLVEEMIVQAYRDTLTDFQTLLQDPDLIAARNHIPTAVGILTGLKDQPVAMDLIQQKVQVARAMDYDGVSFFFYETLWNAAGEQPEDRLNAVRSLFANPMPRPEVPANRTDRASPVTT